MPLMTLTWSVTIEWYLQNRIKIKMQIPMWQDWTPRGDWIVYIDNGQALCPWLWAVMEQKCRYVWYLFLAVVSYQADKDKILENYPPHGIARGQMEHRNWPQNIFPVYRQETVPEHTYLTWCWFWPKFSSLLVCWWCSSFSHFIDIPNRNVQRTH